MISFGPKILLPVIVDFFPTWNVLLDSFYNQHIVTVNLSLCPRYKLILLSHNFVGKKLGLFWSRKKVFVSSAYHKILASQNPLSTPNFVFIAVLRNTRFNWIELFFTTEFDWNSQHFLQKVQQSFKDYYIVVLEPWHEKRDCLENPLSTWDCCFDG